MAKKKAAAEKAAPKKAAPKKSASKKRKPVSRKNDDPDVQAWEKGISIDHEPDETVWE